MKLIGAEQMLIDHGYSETGLRRKCYELIAERNALLAKISRMEALTKPSIVVRFESEQAFEQATRPTESPEGGVHREQEQEHHGAGFDESA